MKDYGSVKERSVEEGKTVEVHRFLYTIVKVERTNLRLHEGLVCQD